MLGLDGCSTSSEFQTRGRVIGACRCPFAGCACVRWPLSLSSLSSAARVLLICCRRTCRSAAWFPARVPIASGACFAALLHLYVLYCPSTHPTTVLKPLRDLSAASNGCTSVRRSLPTRPSLVPLSACLSLVASRLRFKVPSPTLPKLVTDADLVVFAPLLLRLPVDLVSPYPLASLLERDWQLELRLNLLLYIHPFSNQSASDPFLSP